MNQTHFVKSFSQGQITIPKQFRQALGLTNVFWLKLTLFEGKIIAEPTIVQPDKSNYSQKLTKVDGQWFDIEDWEKTRKQIQKRKTL